MAITNDDLLQYAKILAKGGGGEAELRASLSRSYYAAFHALLPLVELLPPSHKSRGAEVNHFEITERLVEWRVESICPSLLNYKDIKARAQRAMDAARAKRIVADYRLGQDVSCADCNAQVERVGQIIRAANTLLGVIDSMESSASA